MNIIYRNREAGTEKNRRQRVRQRETEINRERRRDRERLKEDIKFFHVCLTKILTNHGKCKLDNNSGVRTDQNSF